MLGTISAAALWQIAYAPYVSDYSRYMPRDTGVDRHSGRATGAARWARFCQWCSARGRAGRAEGNLVAGLAFLTAGIAPLVLMVFAVGVAAANAMNLYCGALSTLTFGQTLFPRWQPGPAPGP